MLHWVFFEVLGYPVSYLEFVSVSFGLAAVYLATREKLLTWPLGIINIATAFVLFYNVRLYADMFLQIYFFLISLYGWYFWKREKSAALPLKRLSIAGKYKIIIALLLGTLGLGWCIQNLHVFFPRSFPEPAAYPYADTFVAVASIVANTLLARRVIENWLIWIATDVLCIFLYFDKNIKFVAFEYCVFLALATYGWISWKKMYQVQISNYPHVHQPQ